MSDIENNFCEGDAKTLDIGYVQLAIDQLMQRFETVQIFCTRDSPVDDIEGTIHVEKGQGNFYARYGHVNAWIKQMDGDHFNRRE